MSAGAVPPGLRLDRLRDFLRTTCGADVGDLSARLLTGGKSNLTYLVADGTHEWVVRRPPLGHVLATAHDMSREFRVMSALRDTDVPVPLTYALCQDESVLGAPFYVMERVHGVVYATATDLAAVGPERTAHLCRRTVETLGVLHRVDPTAVGLADFGRPDGFLARQVVRWRRQLEASRSRPLIGADELYGLLERHLPPEQPAAIVHGDYRLDNVLMNDDDHVVAVLDWEMATLGDPLTDVALMLVYGDAARMSSSITDVASAPGFLSRAEFLDHYARTSGQDLGAMHFYLGLAYFKLAVILEGIHYRHLQGQTVGEGFDSVGRFVEPLLAAGIDAFKER